MKQLFTFFIVLFSLSASANNIEVSNVSLQSNSSSEQLIQFDVSWENSWRTGSEVYDGAWIFAKFRKMGAPNQPWQHCTIKQQGTIPGSGAIIDVTNDGIGTFIYNKEKGVGNVNYTKNKLVWDINADGVPDGESVEIKVFALEMVYIPKGAFYLGTGGNEHWHFFTAGSNNKPFYVANNNPIQVGSSAGNLAADNYTLGNYTIPTSYPKGYNAFWSMKYEITEQQFVDFLNHIPQDYAQDILAAVVVKSSFNWYAQEITGSWPEYEAAAPERAMTVLSANMFINMARWTGLRPMTELEFEKICRGVAITPTPNEYPWGTTTKVNLKTVNNQGHANEEVATPSFANAAVGAISRPVRAGLFARPSNSTRELSGAAYYGVLNMGDNASEWVGQVTSTELRENEHGKGQYEFDNITTDHFSDQIYYLKNNDHAHLSAFDWSQTSNRSGSASINQNNKDYAEPGSGGRFVRTAD